MPGFVSACIGVGPTILRLVIVSSIHQLTSIELEQTSSMLVVISSIHMLTSIVVEQTSPML